MKAKIVRLDPFKQSRTEKIFRRVYFTLENGQWAKTDLVPQYRNYKTWKPFLDRFEKGEVVYIDNVRLRTSQEVDADSMIQKATEGFSTEVVQVLQKKPEQQLLI